MTRRGMAVRRKRNPDTKIGEHAGKASCGFPQGYAGVVWVDESLFGQVVCYGVCAGMAGRWCPEPHSDEFR